MYLSKAEQDLIGFYRTLDDKDRLLLRRVIHLQDAAALAVLRQRYGERLDCLRRLTVAHGDDQGAFLSA